MPERSESRAPQALHRRRTSRQKLKALARVELDPGESRTIQFQIPARNFAYYDSDLNDWVVETVAHDLVVASSADPADANLLQASFSAND